MTWPRRSGRRSRGTVRATIAGPGGRSAWGGVRPLGLLRDLLTGRRYWPHMSAEQARLRIPRAIWDGYFKFCVERNPWDKVVSQWSMQLHKARTSPEELPFDRFVRERRFRSDWRMYAGQDGRLLVDAVLAYERLDAELGEVFQRLGVPWEGRLSVRAKTGIRVSRGPWQALYDDQTRTIVAEAFRREIEHFGWRFE